MKPAPPTFPTELLSLRDMLAAGLRCPTELWPLAGPASAVLDNAYFRGVKTELSFTEGTTAYSKVLPMEWLVTITHYFAHNLKYKVCEDHGYYDFKQEHIRLVFRCKYIK